MAEVGWGFLVPGSEIMEEGGYGPHRNSQNLPGTEGHSGSGLEAVVGIPYAQGSEQSSTFPQRSPNLGKLLGFHQGP